MRGEEQVRELARAMFGVEDASFEQQDRALRAFAALGITSWNDLDDLRHEPGSRQRGVGPVVAWPKVGPAWPPVLVIALTQLELDSLKLVLATARAACEDQGKAAAGLPEKLRDLVSARTRSILAAESQLRVRLAEFEQ